MYLLVNMGFETVVTDDGITKSIPINDFVEFLFVINIGIMTLLTGITLLMGFIKLGNDSTRSLTEIYDHYLGEYYLPEKYHPNKRQDGIFYWGDIPLFLNIWFVQKRPIYLSTIVGFILLPTITIIATAFSLLSRIIYVLLYSDIKLDSLFKFKDTVEVDNNGEKLIPLRKIVDFYRCEEGKLLMPKNTKQDKFKFWR